MGTIDLLGGCQAPLDKYHGFAVMHPVSPYRKFPLELLDLRSRRHDIAVDYRVEPGDFPGFNSFDQAVPSISFQI